ncbi:hypothetical protein PGIGA_G00060920 [Pangasianodon gigas]|uniref:Uncharacterized protein n=1 Tax=Pangasianodon gigas TaxID=30993 RepID=A0ACC5X5H0_PANGG|nr:hypothetical protein [Pangasianodon gigas]
MLHGNQQNELYLILESLIFPIMSLSVIIKWGGQEYSISALSEDDTVLDLKQSIKSLTGVLPERQKLLGLKIRGKPADNDTKLGLLKLKPNTKIMMMGSREESLEDVLAPPPESDDVINDFDIEEEVIEVENREENLAKIARRVKEYKVEELNPPREGKRLLVLDVDYTLFGKPADNDTKLGLLKLKPNTKIMMMGSREESLEDVLAPPPESDDVINDFDIEEEVIEVENREENLAKIARRVKEYKVEELNPPREGKRLLVLDVDYTLFDHKSCAETGQELMRPFLHEFLTSAYEDYDIVIWYHKSCAETGQELMRPFLHEFLTSAYEDYDIVIWSATSMKWIDAKMKELGVSDNPNYKITFMLDSGAMITVHTPKRGVVEVKPLGVIWGKYSEFYNRKNTIMFDDIGRNFLMNPQNGLKIRPFMKAHLNREKDKELLKLSHYLKEIAKLDDFSGLNHKHWERYLSKKQSQ